MSSSLSPVGRMPVRAERASISVLIVDDEHHVRTYLTMILRSIGIVEMWQARHGAEAISLYRAHQPVAVLLDLNMPTLNGEKTLGEIKALDEGAAIVMMTSQNDLAMIKRCRELGALGYVLKFAPKETVAAAIAESLDKLIETDAEADGVEI